MANTPNLALPLLAAGQAQKHVTLNEASYLVDDICQLAVIDRDLPSPPATPAAGDRYLVASGASGAWTGKSGQIAAWSGFGWEFRVPKRGWRVWIGDESRLLVHDGAIWIDAVATGLAGAAPQNLAMLGVNTTADTTNRLAVKAAASLFDHAGGDHRQVINRAGTANTASMIFQSGYSGRAEMGIAGDDRYRIKVSADGSTWFEALSVDQTNGDLILGGGGAERARVTATALRPVADNAVSLGAGGLRWSVVHAATGTINTSDARLKSAIRPLGAAEIAAAQALAAKIGAYRFLASIAEKGEAAREHVGLTVQQAIEVMAGHGLAPFDYGFICKDAMEAEAGEPAVEAYGFRSDELLLFIVRGLEARLAALEAQS